MDKKGQNREGLYIHKLTIKIGLTSLCHVLISGMLKEGKDIQGEQETIIAARNQFREFLELVLKGHYRPLPKDWDEEKVDELYTRSDFDWTEREKFDIFHYWYNHNT